MTPKNDLEIRGNFLTHPFAEVIAEIMAAGLSGAMRAEHKEHKSVVYFREGSVAFAASNARAMRMRELLLEKKKITKADLAQVPAHSNDFELTAYLEGLGLLTSDEIKSLFSEQATRIVADVLEWNDGSWTFSCLARARDGLEFAVKTRELLIEHARAMSTDQVLKRFRTLNEKFRRSEADMSSLVLTQNEAFVVSRADAGALTAADLANVAAMRVSASLHVLYTMWLGGLLVRSDWQPAFDAGEVAAMRSAKLELKTQARTPEPVVMPKSAVSGEEISDDDLLSLPMPEPEPQVPITVDEYLDRVESATTYYDVLGLDPKAETADIRKAYFTLAKMFHPDKYHSAGGDVRKRVQNAFTEMAQAHETLKDEKNRELYDYKMRNELKVREQAAASGESVSMSHQLMQAADHFERGFSLLMDNEIDAATPFLARAVYYAPKNARYHAYYGKALSTDAQSRHKAESEMQAALKIDPNNETFRLMLVEFFIQVGLKKRAEGELTRLLSVFPSNREAKELLATLKKA